MSIVKWDSNINKQEFNNHGLVKRRKIISPEKYQDDANVGIDKVIGQMVKSGVEVA